MTFFIHQKFSSGERGFLQLDNVSAASEFLKTLARNGFVDILLLKGNLPLRKLVGSLTEANLTITTRILGIDSEMIRAGEKMLCVSLAAVATVLDPKDVEVVFDVVEYSELHVSSHWHMLSGHLWKIPRAFLDFVSDDVYADLLCTMSDEPLVVPRAFFYLPAIQHCRTIGVYPVNT